jgi:hypothetical protein
MAQGGKEEEEEPSTADEAGIEFGVKSPVTTEFWEKSLATAGKW